jgi:hypothetical protein
MLFDGKQASSLTTNRQLSDRQWAKIQGHLVCPTTRDEFEKIVARHFKGSAARERQRTIDGGYNSPESLVVADFFVREFNRRGMVVARKGGIMSICPREDLARDGWTYVGPVTSHHARL